MLPNRETWSFRFSLDLDLDLTLTLTLTLTFWNDGMRLKVQVYNTHKDTEVRQFEAINSCLRPPPYRSFLWLCPLLALFPFSGEKKRRRKKTRLSSIGPVSKVESRVGRELIGRCTHSSYACKPYNLFWTRSVLLLWSVCYVLLMYLATSLQGHDFNSFTFDLLKGAELNGQSLKSWMILETR